MGRWNNRLGVIAFLLALPILFSSCSKSSAVPDDAAQQMQQLGQEYLEELYDDILPQRDNENKLVELGLVVNSGNTTQGIEALDEFYENYESGKPSQLTFAVYSSSPLVVSRLIFLEDGTGYYFRYVLDESAESLSVKPQRIDKATLTVENSGKASLAIQNGRHKVATFTFFY